MVTSCATPALTESELDLSHEANRFSSFEKEFFNQEKLQKEADAVESFKSTFTSNNFNAVKSELQFLSSEIQNKKFASDEYNCENRPEFIKANFYYFLPDLKSVVKEQDQVLTFSNGCFKSNAIKIEKLSADVTVLTLTSSEPKNFYCSDSYWIATTNINKLIDVITHGTHKITLKNLSQDDLDEIRVSGFRVMTFCQGFFTSLHSLFMSVKLYVGGLGHDTSARVPIMRPEVPQYMVDANIEFLGKFANFRPQNRGEFGKKILDIDEKEIKTGDFLVIYRLDGLDPLIMFGSGSRSGHSAVACWIDGELHVLESQDGWYWPKRGIQRNKFSQWIQWAHNADFNVAILPLRQEIRDKLNVDKALSWFVNGIEGLNYGYHNFLFGWLDTPNKNLNSDIIQMEVFGPLFAVFERVTKQTAALIIGDALNMRMGTKGLSLPQVTAVAARKGFTIEDMLAMPELDEWRYSDGQNYVCSSFVIAFWRAAGVFDDMYISPAEFTPRDVYLLDIYDLEYKNRRPQICKDADPTLPYCQIIGKYQVLLDGYNTVKPYSHMNEKCPSIAPEYVRPDGC